MRQFTELCIEKVLKLLHMVVLSLGVFLLPASGAASHASTDVDSAIVCTYQIVFMSTLSVNGTFLQILSKSYIALFACFVCFVEYEGICTVLCASLYSFSFEYTS